MLQQTPRTPNLTHIQIRIVNGSMDTSPSPSTLYSLSFFLALCVTLFVAATLRLLTLLPNRRSKPQSLCKRPLATRILVVLGSGGHTAEMFRLLKDLDPRKYTHRTYVVSSGDAFSAQRAIEFERRLEKREKERDRDLQRAVSGENVTHASPSAHKRAASRAGQEAMKSLCVGPNHFNISFVPRARKIHQSLLTTPFSCLRTLFSALTILHPSPPTRNANDPYQAAAHDLPDLIITNGPATSSTLR